MQGNFASTVKKLPPVWQRVMAGAVALTIFGSLVGAFAAPRFKISYWCFLTVFPIGGALAGYITYWGEGRSVRDFAVDPKQAKGAYSAATSMILEHLASGEPGTPEFEESLRLGVQLTNHAQSLQGQVIEEFVATPNGVFNANNQEANQIPPSATEPDPGTSPEVSPWDDAGSNSLGSSGETSMGEETHQSIPSLESLLSGVSGNN